MKVYSFDQVKLTFEKFLSTIGNFLTNKNELITIQNKLRRHFNTATSDYLCSEEFRALLSHHHHLFEEKNSSTKYFTLLASFDEQLKKHSIKSIKSTQLSDCTSSITITHRDSASSDNITVRTPSPEAPEPDPLTAVIQETMEYLLGQCENILPVTKRVSRERRAIIRLERRLRQLSQLIRSLEKEDMSLDEMANCDLYAVESRLKEEACQVYEELAELKKQSASTKRILHQPITLNESETGHPLINGDLQEMVNQSINFPSFSDVLKTVKKANEKHKLNLTDEVQQTLAEKSFRSIGRVIKTRRMADFHDIMSSRLPKNFNIDENDPALNNAEIESVLLKNQHEAVTKTEQILEEYSRIELDPDDVIDTEDQPVVEEKESDMVVESSGTTNVVSISPPEPSNQPVLETDSTIEVVLNEQTFIVLSTASLPPQIPSSSMDIEEVKFKSSRSSSKQTLSDNEIIYRLYERRLTNQSQSMASKRPLPNNTEYSIVKKHKQPEVIVID